MTEKLDNETRNPQLIERFYRNIRRAQQVRIVQNAYQKKT